MVASNHPPSTSASPLLLAQSGPKLFLLLLHLELALPHLLDPSDEKSKGSETPTHSLSSNLSNRASVDAKRTLNSRFLPLLPLLDKPAQTDE